VLRSNQLRSAWLILTNRCNLRCNYCWVPTFGELIPPASMSFETACQSIEFLKQNSLEGISITLFGGEPLLEFETIKQLMNCYPYMNWSLYTNTLLMDREMIEFFYHRRDFIVLKLSIDGRINTQLKNRGRMYDELLVKEIFQRFPTSEARITINNPEGVYEDVLHIQNLGARHISLKVTNFLNLDEEFYTRARVELDKISDDQMLKDIVLISDGTVLECCNIVSDYIAIAPNGDIYPCDIFYWLQENCIGNISTGFNSAAVDRICSSINRVKEHPIGSCIAEQLYFEDVAINNKKSLKGMAINCGQ